MTFTDAASKRSLPFGIARFFCRNQILYPCHSFSRLLSLPTPFLCSLCVGISSKTVFKMLSVSIFYCRVDPAQRNTTAVHAATQDSPNTPFQSVASSEENAIPRRHTRPRFPTTSAQGILRLGPTGRQSTSSRRCAAQTPVQHERYTDRGRDCDHPSVH